MSLKVSDVARRSGVTPGTVRFYEKEGLLPAPTRTTSGYRAYESTTPQRIRFIKGAQEMGLKLAEIRELLDIQDKGACPCGHTKTLVERRIDEIDAEMARLGEMRSNLAAMAALECSATNDSELWNCETQFPTTKGGER